MTTKNLGNYELRIGDPVILENAKGLGEYGLRKGMKGVVNSIINLEGQKLIYFYPDNLQEIFVTERSRFAIDEERMVQMQAEEEESQSDA